MTGMLKKRVKVARQPKTELFQYADRVSGLLYESIYRCTYI